MSPNFLPSEPATDTPDLRPSRRDLLAGALALGFAAATGTAEAAAQKGLRFGPAQPFSFARLRDRVKVMAAMAYKGPPRPAPDIVSKIDYEAHGKIRFKAENALFADGPGEFPATFFHLGMFFGKTIRMFEVTGPDAREILYSADYFDMPKDSPARGLPENAGFAGFRFQESRSRKDWPTNDWIAFLGASYFRAIGELFQYGLSARGIAIDVAAPVPEEFPDFTEFYLEPGAADSNSAIVYALLDGPSVVGAYKFTLYRDKAVTTDIDAFIMLRKPVYRLGLAPLTSMFWFAEYGKGLNADWRPEVHDSDGLALWTGAGERIWRPLNNPPRVMTSAFLDDHPRGFGLVQRDRNFDDYRDGVHYERRPTVWVEPKGDWGAGAVQLVEIPTDDEIHDNIVAFWVPAEDTKEGSSYDLSYRIHWRAAEPFPPEGIAETIATRLGNGGEPGKPRPKGVRKFMVEFAGPVFGALKEGQKVEAVLSASRGTLSYVFTEPVPGMKDQWRAQFDLTTTGLDPVDLRLYLRTDDGRPLTETWIFQYFPTN